MYYGHLYIIKLLILECVIIEKANIIGCAPTIRSSSNGCLDIVKVVIIDGVNIHQTTNYGTTPIFRAKLEDSCRYCEIINISRCKYSSS
jgi:hypothetical protein